MSGDWRTERLPELARALAGRPRHEALRGHIMELLRSGFGAPYDEINQEVYLLDGSGRIDTMWGSTVIELKTNLAREIGDVHARLPDYLRDAAPRAPSPRLVTGIATDGALFIAYELRAGALHELARYETDANHPDELIAWLEPLLSDRPDLIPEPRAVVRAFGRASLTFGRARSVLETIWSAIGSDPEVQLKRDLWNRLLREAYGDDVDEDSLFLQHTYLTVVVKAIAARVLDLPVDHPADMLSGRALADEGILGAVEADFFDWPLKVEAGADLVRHIARQTARFRLRDVETDVLKILYESLVDPEQRHDLGEYYTPDWLAGRIVAGAVQSPLKQRVLDPACGSGTFLFHAIRHLTEAAREAGWTGPRILQACAENVRGLDVHPVAVTLARVTWLLALGDLVEDRTSALTVPVFLGDAMQWNLRRYVDGADVLVEVPGEDRPLQIPAGVAEDQTMFERALDTLNQGLADGSTPEVVGRALHRIADIAQTDATALVATYSRLKALYADGRNGIWTFVFRNLVRPVWLSRQEQLSDVLVGNPPWIVYRHLSPGMKDRLREALSTYDLWVGGNLATQQDMCALFWARGAERYLRQGGEIAFVLPYAVMNGPVFAGIRNGRLGQTRVRLTGGWMLERVWPIFGAQSGSSTTSTCVLFGHKQMAGAHPIDADRWQGRLPRRDANESEAAQALAHTRVLWPRPRTLVGASPYRARFQQGATLVPRRFILVEPEPIGRLGRRRDAPRMRGRAGALDKYPWSTIEPPSGPIEVQFLRQVVLGESIAPFLLLGTATAVIPLDGLKLMDSVAASDGGYRHLAAWLNDAEQKWTEHSNKDISGQPRATLIEGLDHMHKLSAQAGTLTMRVFYTASGTRLSAVRLAANDAIAEHGAYWAAVRSQHEAAYLLAVLNSEAILQKVTDLQPHGEAGTRRHFDNLVWTLPIPEYDHSDQVHRDLAAAAVNAERVAASVDLTTYRHFTAKDGLSEMHSRLTE